MRLVLSAVLVVALFGCGKKKEESSKTTTTEAKPTEAKPADPATAPAAPSTVDTCAFVSKDQVKTILGLDPDGDGEKTPATGSMLGGCNWRDKDFKSMLSLQARPSGEFETTAKYAKNSKELPGLGEKAYMTDTGLFVQPAGKPYFLHVMAMSTDGKQIEAKATELAKAALAGAK